VLELDGGKHLCELFLRLTSVNSYSPRMHKYLLQLLFLFLAYQGYGQAIATSNSCSCDGGYNYVSSLAPPLTYNLYNPANTLVSSGNSNSTAISFTNLCSSVYRLEVSNGQQTIIAAINVPSSAINPGVAVTTSICSSSPAVTLSNLITGEPAGGSWTNPNGVPHNGNFLPGSQPGGLYTYTFTDGACTSSTGVYIEIIQNADPGLSATALICENYVPINLFDYLNGSPDPGGDWIGPTGAMNGIYDPATMSDNDFVYRIDTVPGCTPVFATVTVIENQLSDPGLDNSILVCPGATAFNMFNYISGTPETGGSWFNQMNLPTDGIFDSATETAGTYRYVVFGDTPCPNASSYLTINFTNTNPSGANGSVTLCANSSPVNMINYLNGSPVNGGVWRNAANQIVDGFYNPTNEPAGNYSYYYPNVGCSPASSVLTITIETPPNAGPDQTFHFCQGTPSINLTSLLPPSINTNGIWLQSGAPVSNPIIPGGPANTNYSYWIQGTVCPTDASVHTIIIDPLPSAPGDETLTLCSTDAPFDLLTLYPGSSNLYFENAIGSTLSTSFNPSTQTTQEISVFQSSNNVCPDAQSSIQITVDSPIFPDSIATFEFCETAGNIDLTQLVTGIDYSIGQWNTGGSNTTNTTLALNGNQTYNYIYTVDLSTVCPPSILELNIESFDEPDAGGDANAVFCHTDPSVALAALLPIAASGEGDWYYNSNAVVSSSLNPNVDPEGIYSYILPANGPCPASSADLAINIDYGFVLEAGNFLEACTGNGQGNLGILPSTGIVYTWTPSTLLSASNISNPTVSLINNGNSPLTIDYTLEGSNGVCTQTDEVSVTINPLPIINAPDEVSICLGEIVELSASGGTAYNWSPASLFFDPTAASQSFVPTDDEIITVEASNQFGCTASTTVDLTVYALPQIVFVAPDTASCPPYSFELFIDSTSYNYSTIDWYLNGPIDLYGAGDLWQGILTEPGFYHVTYTAVSEDGCSISNTQPSVFEIYSEPTALFDYSPVAPSTIFNSVEFTNWSIDAEENQWWVEGKGPFNTTDLSWTFDENEPGEFEICLIVHNTQGCLDSTCQVVNIANDRRLFVPNAFTPDNDDLNEVFKPILLGYDTSNYEFSIIDRWGITIFSTNNIDEGWTGNVQNGIYYTQNDVFEWRISVKDRDTPEYYIFRGHVTVLR